MRQGGEVVILGGGVIGLTAAYFLAREGVHVYLVDRHSDGPRASWAGAGILPPSDWPSARDPLDRLRALSCRLFPDLSAELQERTGIDNGYRRCGGLEILRQNGHVPNGHVAAHEWAGEGITSESLDESGARRLEPALAPGLGRARHLPALAQVRNPRHLQALRQACGQTQHVRFEDRWGAVEWQFEGSRVSGVLTPGGVIEGDTFLVATGAWANRLLEPLGVHTGIRPIRGQIALLNHPDEVLFRRVLIWGSRYLVPRHDGYVLAGSTEEDVGFHRCTTVEGIDSLLRLAVTLVPALAQAAVERCWAGLRPGSPDGLPFIGRVPGIDNVFVAAGHFRAGIQLSPGTALLVKELVLGQPLTMPLEAFRTERIAGDH